MFFLSKAQVKTFYIILLAIWSISSIYTMINNGVSKGLLVLIFGVGLIASIYYAQKFFIKMINAENKAYQKLKK